MTLVKKITKLNFLPETELGKVPIYADKFNYLIDLLFGTSLTVGKMYIETIVEATTDAGVTIDGLLIKDGGIGGPLIMTGTPQTLTGAGAVSLTTYATLLVTTGANALTLAAGTEGQRKFIKMKTDGGDGTLTPSSLQGGATITFNDAGDFVELLYLDSKWNVVTNSGATVG